MKKNNRMKIGLAGLLLTFFTGCGLEQKGLPIEKKLPVSTSTEGMNPIVPQGMYIADPEVRQMPDGRIYLYGSRDEPGNPWCSYAYHVMSSSDLSQWDVDQFSFATKGVGKQTDYTDDVLYAPDCISFNGKYYLYYCLATDGENEGVAVSDSPYGPFRDGQKIVGITGIDPSIFIDDDGQAYLFWGQNNAKGAKLSKDMKTIEGEIHDKLLTYDKHFFSEGSSVRKINGIYYFIYAGHPRHEGKGCHTLCYATSDSPFGPYEYRGVIIDNYACDREVGNNHGSLIEIDGQWYVFYHRATHGTNTMRKACIEPIYFNSDGTIREAEMTTQGVMGPISPLLRMDASRACTLMGNLIVKVRRPEHDIPVEYLSEIRDGDVAYWKYYDFSSVDVNHFTCKTWGRNKAASIEIRLDSAEGELLGVCQIKPMERNVAYSIHETQVKPVQGKHALVFVFKAADGEMKDTNLMNLEWFTFENKVYKR